MPRRTLKILVPLVVVAVGIATAVLLASARSTPERTERKELGPLVEVLEVAATDVEVAVKGHGQVVPRVAVNVVPQVTGQVIEVHRSLAAGGFFRANEPLLVIDPRDYELAVERAEAIVARAHVGLEQEEAEAEVARSEWEALNPEEEPPSGLVIREPQIRQARAELESARADLEFARLNLGRTRVSVPFDGVVVSEQVDVGQFVSTGSPIATVYGTDMVEVRVPMESRELAWFQLPAPGRDDGPTAEVRASFAGRTLVWSGRVDRMEAVLDEASRMVNVVVQVRQPYSTADGRLPLLPGTFAEVTIAGDTISGVVPIPRHAVHENSTVWVVAGDRLQIRTVEIARADREQALVTTGLADADRIVVSSLDAVTDGMVVRPVASEGGDV